MTSPRGPEVPYIFLLQSPLPFLHSFIQSSFYCSLNQTNRFRQRWPCVCNYAYYLHLLYACIMQKKSLPKLRSSPHLWIRPPPSHPPLIHAIILSSSHFSFLLPANQSFRDGCFLFIDVYFMYQLWSCIMQKKLFPRPRRSVYLWIRLSIPLLIHAVIPSSFHPCIPQSNIFQFLQN